MKLPMLDSGSRYVEDAEGSRRFRIQASTGTMLQAGGDARGEMRARDGVAMVEQSYVSVGVWVGGQ